MAPSKNLWLNIYNGDRKAYEEIFIYYFNRYCNYGKKFTDDSTLIEDAAQETMMAIWNKRENIPSINQVAAYYYTSFRYILFTRIKQKIKFVGEDHIIEDPQFSIDHFMIKDELDDALKARMKKAISNLTDRQREAIFLRFYEEMSYEEIAHVMNITTKATYKIMSRALATLKENLSVSTHILLAFLQGSIL